MKRLFLSPALLALCAPVATAQWFEDFDSYTPSSQVVGQGGWEEWGPGSGALVTNARSRTPGNSIDINGPSDLVHQYSGINAGTWVYTAHQYIPTGATGSTYFILLNTYAYPSGPYSWSAQVLFNNTTGMASQRCGGTATISMPFVYDQWAEIKVVLHMDQDWVQIYYNGTLFDDPAVADHATLGGGYRWSLGDGGTNTTGVANFAAVDLFANNATSAFYDDISLVRQGSWYEDFDAYAATSQVVGQGGWEEWGPGAGALVSNAQSLSAPNAIDINGPTDLVHQYSISSGTWVYRLRQFVPTGMTGQSYCILLNTYAYPSGPYSWSAQLKFDAATGQVSQNCGGAAVISMPFVSGQWAEIKVVLYLDQDWVKIYYNGQLFDDPAVANHATLGGGYRWSLGDFGTNTTGAVHFGAVDLYANNATSVYYDDISLTPLDWETIGKGCAGTMPAAQLKCQAPPRLGMPMMVEITNLPQSLALLGIGFDIVNSPLGALPLDLSPFGFTGCKLFTNPLAVQLIAGSGNTAMQVLPIPNIAALEGAMFYEQAMVMDPSANAVGAVVSDAAAGLIRR